MAVKDWSSYGVTGYQGNMYCLTNANARWLQQNGYLATNTLFANDNNCPTVATLNSYANASAYGTSEYAGLGSDYLCPIGYIEGVPIVSYGFELGIKTNNASNLSVNVWYRIGISGVWTETPFGNPLTAYSPNHGIYSSAILAPTGSTIYIAVQNTSDADVQFGTGLLSNIFTGYCGKTTPYSYTFSTGLLVYLNVNSSGGSLVTC